MNQSNNGFHLGRLIRLILIITMVVVLAILVFQNRESVETRILFSKVVMPRAALLFVTFSIGTATGILGSWAFASRRRRITAK